MKAQNFRGIVLNLPLSQLLLGITSSLRDHYIFISLLTFFLLNSSFQSFLALFLGLIFNHLLLNIIHQIKSRAALHFMIIGKVKPTLDLSTEWKLEKIDLERFTTKETYEEIQEANIFKIQGQDFKNYINIYRFYLEETELKKTGGIQIASNIVCFSRPFSDSYIFLDVNPEKMNAFSRFKALHEIGHAILSPFFIQTRRQGGFLVFIGYIYVLYHLIDLNSLTLLSIIAYCSIFTLRLFFQVFYWFKADFIDEIFADLFGLMFLTPDDAKEIEEKTGRFLSRFFHNDKFLYFFRTQRESIFRKNLSYLKEGDTDSVFESTIKIMMPKYPFFRYAFWIAVYASIGLHFKLAHSISFLIWPTLILFIVFIYYFYDNYKTNIKIKAIFSFLIDKDNDNTKSISSI